MGLIKAVDFRWQRFYRKGATLILAFFWILGLVSGFLVSYFADNSVYSLMRGSVFASVSIVWLFVVSIFPFLFSALAVFLSFPWALYPICFLRALQYGFVFAGLNSAWGSTAWCIRIAVLFDDFVLLPVLYWFWHNHISGEKNFSYSEAVYLFLAVVLVLLGIHRYFMPFFSDVFTL